MVNAVEKQTELKANHTTSKLASISNGAPSNGPSFVSPNIAASGVLPSSWPFSSPALAAQHALLVAQATKQSAGSSKLANGSASALAGMTGSSRELGGSGRSPSTPIKAPNIAPAKAASDVEATELLSLKRKRGPEDFAVAKSNKTRIAKLLAENHRRVLSPDIETPFADSKDVVARLLPYHVFQHSEEELRHSITSARSAGTLKGKEKESFHNQYEPDQVPGDTFLDLWKQKKDLEMRFRKIRTKEAEYTSPPDCVYWLTQATLESDRELNAQLSSQLREARGEKERADREKRLASLAAASANRTPQTPTVANTAAPKAPVTAAPNALSYTAYANAYAQYYQSYATMLAARGYATAPFTATYPYAQLLSMPNAGVIPPSSPITPTHFAGMMPFMMPPMVSASSTAPSSTSSGQATPLIPNHTPLSTAGSTPIAPEQITPITPALALPENPFAVSIPASALSGLNSLGIYPVPVANIQPPPAPQPAVIIVGISDGGQVLNLSVYLTRLERTQMAGLSVFLRSLVPNTGQNGVTPSGSSVPTSAIT